MQNGFTNGIDVTTLTEVRNTVKDDPAARQVTFRASNRWDFGAHGWTTIQDFRIGGQEYTARPAPFVIDVDEPEVLLGTNQAPNPTEALLYALSSCIVTTFAFYASAMGVSIEELHLDISGDLDLRGFLGVDDSVNPGFSEIRTTFRVKADASEDRIRELCRLAQEHSPVYNIVTRGTPVTAKVELAGTEQDVSMRQAA